jgi:hypothetical protein
MQGPDLIITQFATDIIELQIVEGVCTGGPVVLDQRPANQQDHQFLTIEVVEAGLLPEPLDHPDRNATWTLEHRQL